MALEEDLYELARHPVLACLEPEALRRLIASAVPWTLRPSEVLFRRDERSDGGFFLRSGSLALDPLNPDKPNEIIKAPALIGEMALIAPTRRPTTATAREPSSVLSISRQMFQRVLGESPRSAERLRRLVAERVQRFSKELDELRKTMLESE